MEKVHSTYGNLDKLLFFKYLNILIYDDLEFVKKENLDFFYLGFGEPRDNEWAMLWIFF